MSKMDTLSLRRIEILDGLHHPCRLIAHHHEPMYPHCRGQPVHVEDELRYLLRVLVKDGVG